MKFVVWSVVIILVAAFVIFQGRQCAYENELEEAFDDSEAVMEYIDTLVDFAERDDELSFEAMGVYSQLQWSALSNYNSAWWELNSYRQSRWWNRGGPVEPVR